MAHRRTGASPRSITVWAIGLSIVSLPVFAAPFDIEDPTPRSVAIWIDDNVNDPSIVGQNLRFAFDGFWSSAGGVGTIVVDRFDVARLLIESDLNVAPFDVLNWSDLTIELDLKSLEIMSIHESGRVGLGGLGIQAFSFDLNTLRADVAAGSTYTQTGFAIVNAGGNFVAAWCTDTFKGNVGPLACPPHNGPEPSGYDPATGRFNAIGAININDFLYIYSTSGDAQLREMPEPSAAWLGAASFLSLAALRRRANRRQRAGCGARGASGERSGTLAAGAIAMRPRALPRGSGFDIARVRFGLRRSG